MTVATPRRQTDTVKTPRLAVPLTDIQPRTAKPREQPYKLADGRGLYLLVNPDGARYWRMDYRLAQKRLTLAFGLGALSPQFAALRAPGARDRALAGVDGH